MASQIGEDPPQPALIAQRLGEGLGLAQVFEDRPVISERKERIAQVEAQIDGLLDGVTTVREMLQRTQRLLEARHRLAVGRARHRLGPGLPAVAQGLVPHLAPQGMVGQPFDLLAQPVGIERLQCLHDLGMQGAPPLLQQAAVGHLAGEGMLEGVGMLREELRLVEELLPWRCARPRCSASSGSPASRCNSGTGTSVPMTAAICTRRFSSGGRRSRRAASTASMVSGSGRVPAWSPCSTAAQVNSSTKKGLPAALATIACCSGAGSCAACGTACSTARLSRGDSRGSAICVAAECPSQGG